MLTDFQSYAGPGDRSLPMNEISGYQPVSRIGEVVQNSFIDAYEFALLQDSITVNELNGSAGVNPGGGHAETKPHFHAWATVQPGMVTVARKKKTAVFRQYIAAETAVPVIACASCLGAADEKNYFFSGIARSKSVRTPDDGAGPTTDEFFTVSLGGMATILNTSGGPVFPGDLIEWAFVVGGPNGTTQQNRPSPNERRIAIQVASVSSPKIIGRALSFSKKGESFDLLLKM